MELGTVGVGRMGATIARRLGRGGHTVVAYNRTPEKAKAVAAEEPNVAPVTPLNGIVERLTRPQPGRSASSMWARAEACEDVLRGTA